MLRVLGEGPQAIVLDLAEMEALVADDSNVLPLPLEPPVGAPWGRGLRLVAGLSSNWGGKATTRGKTMWADLVINSRGLGIQRRASMPMSEPSLMMIVRVGCCPHSASEPEDGKGRRMYTSSGAVTDMPEASTRRQLSAAGWSMACPATNSATANTR